MYAEKTLVISYPTLMRKHRTRNVNYIIAVLEVTENKVYIKLHSIFK